MEIAPRKRSFRTKAIIIGIIAVVAIFSFVFIRSRRLPDVKIEMAANGLKSLKAGGVEFLEGGDFQVLQVTLQKENGETYPGSTNGSDAVDVEHGQVTKTLPWGRITVSYKASGNVLTATVKTVNTSRSETIREVWYQLLKLRFPGKVKEYDGSTPLLAHNLNQVGVTEVSFPSGTLAIVNEDADKPLMVGFPWALNRPVNTVFPLSIHTGRVKMYPDSYPSIRRPIPPLGTDEYRLSARFGREGASEAALVGDVYKRFSSVFPQQLHWTDHRAIGAMILTADLENSTTNPRRWFGDQHLNVLTETGRADFKQRMLSLADGAISIMHEMDAQGMITFDLEGQETPLPKYAGDPRLIEKMAPEMGQIVDEYFGRFRAAGLRTGITVRPQELRSTADGKSAAPAASRDPAAILIDKIAYAKKRWGVTLIYIANNVNSTDPNPMDASIIRKVAAAFPDCLLIPEHSDLAYYAVSIPYKELRQGIVSTPELAREVYPKAASLIYTADGPLDLYRDSLKLAVKSGDILMYRTWFRDAQNDKVKEIYSH